MKHVYIDTNVILHYLTVDPKFYPSASQVFALGVTGKINLYVSAISYHIVFFIMERAGNSPKKIIEDLKTFTSWVTVIPTDQQAVLKALNSKFTDLEDALHHFTATADPKIKAIITNNSKDFKHSTLPVFTTEDYIKYYKTNL